MYSDADFSAVSALDDGVHDEPYTRAVFIRQAACLFPATFLLAEEDSRVIGYAIAGMVQGDGSAGWLLRLYVTANARREGAGTLLLSSLLARMTSFGAGECYLSVSPENGSALPLYRREGFVVVDEVSDYFGRGEDRLIMKKQLKP